MVTQNMAEMFMQIRRMDDDNIAAFLNYFRDLAREDTDEPMTLEDMVEISLNR